jgi:hypothetical protein
MILVGGKHTGKKLVNAIVRGIAKEGTVKLAAMSDKGVQQINNAGQKAANTLGMKVHAMPEEGTVEIDGVYRVALIVTLTEVKEEEHGTDEVKHKTHSRAKARSGILR